jgi:hypothetical protein
MITEAPARVTRQGLLISSAWMQTHYIIQVYFDILSQGGDKNGK